MFARRSSRLSLLVITITSLLSSSGMVRAEGSRNLYPASYPGTGSRANLDLQPGQKYVNRVNRQGFIYVYAQQGEYIILGSSNIGNTGDVNVYNPQDFGARGDETIPATADFTCSAGSAGPGDHFFGANVGQIPSRNAELAGPNSADGSTTVSNGYTACGYQVPVDGIYGVLFSKGTGSGPNGLVSSVATSNNSVAAWEVAVRDSASTTANIDGRVHTYAFLGFTGGNSRPIFSTLYYVTSDGYRYQQDLRGLDPNGYALYANTFGFLDNNQPLYKSLRGTDALVSNLPLGVATQRAQYPIFFSDISPGAPAEAEVAKVLNELGIPLTPPSPQISNVGFNGALGGTVTSTGVGGTFTFTTTDTVSYQIVISRGTDFDPANPLNRILTGIAFSGTHQVTWDGLDNNLEAFPASATPYSYRAYGRNGEVHFPIIDAENNGNGGTVPGGGPTIIRLNGTDPGDRTVFFDDRGYVTSSGAPIGNLNGTLCPTNTPAAATPSESLLGVDSAGIYRYWQNGSNANLDCRDAPVAGWGDAKGVNLWTYFLTPQFTETLEIREFPVDLATTVAMPATAVQGSAVQGTFSFTNNGSSSVNQVSYSMTLSPGLGAVVFSVPPGQSATYNSATGVVTLTGFPTTLAAGQSFSGMTFLYTAPASGPVTASTSIATAGATADSVPENNNATAATALGEVDVATMITGVPATADPGSTVSGAVAFSNAGPQDALGVTYSFSIGSPGNTPTNVLFPALPAGVGASYNSATGVVTLTGMPDQLTVGEVVSVGFSFTAPTTDGSSIGINSAINTTSNDAVASNNADDVITSIAFPPASAIIISAQSVCLQDAPYVEYDITPVNFTPNNLATVEFIGSDNSVVQTLTNQPLTGARILWPGAAVDGDGNGSAWPGWEFTAGQWVAVPSLVRPDLTVRISVNPTSSVTLSYPLTTQSCSANPPGITPPVLDEVDVATKITGVPATADPGSTVSGAVAFSNAGPQDALGVTYSFSIGSPGNTPTNVLFPALPAGVDASYNSATGVVTLTGMPDQLTVGEVVSVGFSFTAPTTDGSSIGISSAITTTSNDAVASNNADDVITSIAFPPASAIIISAQSVCLQDAPYVEYDITPVNFTPNNLATVEFIGSDNSVVQTLTNQPLTGARILWPGAAVDGDGNGSAWPGWEFTAGQWVAVPSLVRPDLTVRISVNPTSSVTLSYPLTTQSCSANPPGVTSPGGGDRAPTAVPVLPIPALAVLLALVTGVGGRQLRRLAHRDRRGADMR